MTPDEAIEKARWYEREDIATTLREEANVLADKVERLRERVGVLEGLLTRVVKYAVEDCAITPGSTRLERAVNEARAALKGSP